MKIKFFEKNKLSNLQKSNFHPKKKKMAKISKTGIFLKKGFSVNLYPLTNFMQNIKKI